jgi:hypothetical protein
MENERSQFPILRWKNAKDGALCSSMNSRIYVARANRSAAAEKTVRKIEAEAIAFVVAQTNGLRTGGALRRGS